MDILLLELFVCFVGGGGLLKGFHLTVTQENTFSFVPPAILTIFANFSFDPKFVAMGTVAVN